MRGGSRWLLAVLLVALTGCGDSTPKRLKELSVAQVCAKLSLGTPVQKRSAAEHLGDRNDRAAVPALIKALEDEDFKCVLRPREHWED